jgi:hypothetical protein
MNPRQAREYKHSQKVKAEEMKFKKEQERMKAENAKQEQMMDKVVDYIDGAIDTEQTRVDWIYGKGAKGKMDVKVELLDDKLLIKVTFTPAEGVKPLEGRAEFGITRTTKW